MKQLPKFDFYLTSMDSAKGPPEMTEWTYALMMLCLI